MSDSLNIPPSVSNRDLFHSFKRLSMMLPPKISIRGKRPQGRLERFRDALIFDPTAILLYQDVIDNCALGIEYAGSEEC